MTRESHTKPVNFLRGVPADETLARLAPMVGQGYADAVERHGTDVLQYGHLGGFAPLREQLAKLHGVDPDRVIVGNGGMEALSLLFKALPPNSTVIVEEATYDRVLRDLERQGHRAVGVALTAEGIDLEGLSKALDAFPAAVFYGIPYHQNPTGICYTEENRREVERLCRARDVICCWDICYQPLRYDGIPNAPVEVSEDGPVLASSFSKTVSPGTKCGYLVLPAPLAKRVVGIAANTRINPNLPTQAFIADFIASGRCDEFASYLKALYRKRMDAMNAALSDHFPDAATARITGGFFTGLHLDAIPSGQAERFIAFAAESGVGIDAGWGAVAPNFMDEKRGRGLFVRLTFPAFEPESIHRGIERLREAVRRFPGEGTAASRTGGSSALPPYRESA